MLMPYAYDNVSPQGKKAKLMKQVLDRLDQKYCNCLDGPAADVTFF